jgi:hypothetical protein
MKLIPLTQGQFAKVDDEDFIILGTLHWNARWNKTSKSFYAYRYLGGGRSNKKNISLHREILGLTDPGIKCDHRNHDTLDCQRHNLRISTISQNGANRKGLDARNTSGIRGVCWNKSKKKWEAGIKVKQKRIFLGRFADKSDASAAYASANRQYFGDFGGVLR